MSKRNVKDEVSVDRSIDKQGQVDDEIVLEEESVNTEAQTVGIKQVRQQEKTEPNRQDIYQPLARRSAEVRENLKEAVKQQKQNNSPSQITYVQQSPQDDDCEEFDNESINKDAWVQEDFKQNKQEVCAEFDGDFSKELEKAHALNQSGLVSFFKDDIMPSSIQSDKLQQPSSIKNQSKADSTIKFEDSSKQNSEIVYRPPEVLKMWKKPETDNESIRKKVVKPANLKRQ